MEHWGTLSVKDHVDARALATEVLIYDRLVMPDWTMGDYQRWQTEGWEPDSESGCSNSERTLLIPKPGQLRDEWIGTINGSTPARRACTA
jgi:hypothetical protein